MRRKLVIALAAVVAGVALWGLARAQLSHDEREEQMKQQMILIQKLMYAEHPEQSPNWRAMSPDLGVLLREDERFGYRGTLYTRVDGQWEPVALDGIERVGYVPLNR